MSQILSLLVRNKPGVLSRVLELFRECGCNVETLNVAPIQDQTISRITLSACAGEELMAQVRTRLQSEADVLTVIPYDPATHVAREMALVRVSVKEETRREVLALSEVFRARVIDASPYSYIFEVTGQSEKIDAFFDNVRVYGIDEVHRTGKLTLTRGSAAVRDGSPAA